MRDTPTARRFAPDEWRLYRALRLGALADAPDAFATTLEQARRRSDAAWSEQLASGAASASELPLLASLRDRPAGMAWGHVDAADRETVHLFGMWVVPDCRRRGVGRVLLDAAVAWARSAGAARLVLDVTRGNEAATRLYVGAGFAAAGPPEPLRPGSPILAQPMRLGLGPDRAPGGGAAPRPGARSR